jgi:hypothetical protein
MDSATTTILWTAIGAILTLLVFSYLLGDNFLFRLVTYLFVGVSAGYVFNLVIFQVIYPRLIQPLMSYGPAELGVFVVVPLILGALLLTKIAPRLAGLGTFSMAYLVGVGAAVAIGGAVFGTLVGQIGGTGRAFIQPGDDFAPLKGLIILIGAASTLAYFQFSGVSRHQDLNGGPVRRSVFVESLATVGQVFVGITLGALFAGVYAAALTALMERLGSLVDGINLIVKFITGG